MTAWRVGSHYGIHVYEGDRPVATFHREEDARRCVAAVTAPAAPDTAALRDAIARWLRSSYPVTPAEAASEADDLLSGPLAELIAERDRYAAQAARVRALADEWAALGTTPVPAGHLAGLMRDVADGLDPYRALTDPT